MKLLISIIICISALLGCEVKQPERGYLLVRGVENAEYEIYQLTDETKQHFIAEEKGVFNSKLSLKPGLYIVMADCSSQTVTIKPHQTVELNAHHINFLPPSNLEETDAFDVQCHRSEDLGYRQKFTSQFEFNVLQGKYEMLVGMKPYPLDFSDKSYKNPVKRTVALSSIIVNSNDEKWLESVFFVSPRDGKIALTQSQNFGRRILVLPGEYLVELNGSKSELSLKAGQEEVKEVGFLRVDVSKSVDTNRALEIRGTPLDVLINKEHQIALNVTYPILPGVVKVNLFGSDRVHEIAIAEEEMHELKVRSVTIESSCSAWYWECLGQRKIYLYEKDKTYPFVEGVTDVPILFTGEDAWVGIEGSFDIRFRLARKNRNINMSLGFVEVVPIPKISTTRITDLVRVETLGGRYFGQTLDLDLLKESKFPLFSGWYTVNGYTTSIRSSTNRSGYKRGFRIRKGRTSRVEIPVYLSKSRYRRYMNKKSKLLNQRQKRIERKWRSAYRPGRRLQYQ